MKKTLLTISAIVACLTSIIAQPNFDMESWTNVPLTTTGVQDPTSWASFNVLTNAFTGAMTQTVFKETTAPYAGLASAKIVTEVLPSSIAVPNPFNPATNMDTVGLLGLGTIVGTTIKFGQPINTRPSILSFACMYTPMTGDSAFIVAYLTHWNGTSRDTIAKGKYATGTATTSYSMQSLNMIYNAAFSAVVPDSEQVYASSSLYRGNGAKVGSTFYVDGFAWSGYVSTNDINGIANTISVYPLPASSEINFESTLNATKVNVFDITGRMIESGQMQNNKAKINVANYTNGIYFYSLMNDKKEIVGRGKFEVGK